METKARFLNPRFNTNVIGYVRTTLLYMNTNIMLEIHRSKVCSPLVCGKRTVGRQCNGKGGLGGSRESTTHGVKVLAEELFL